MNKLLLILFCAVTFFAATAGASAYNILGTACKPGQNGSQGSVCQQNAKQNAAPGNGNPVIDRINTAANIIALIAGIAAVVTIIYSGIQFITAGGVVGGQRAGDNPGGAKKARATLINAIEGLIIVALAWSIVNFVLNAVG
jgi:hypothetical protein